MFAPDAGRAASRALHRVGWFLHAHVVETKFRALRDAVKYGFDPNQPRVPAGNPDGGQWTDGGGGRGGRSDRIRFAQNKPHGYLSDVSPRPRNLPRDIRSLSDIPKEKPSSTQVVNAVIKFVAYELADYIMARGERPIAGRALPGRLLRRFFVCFEIARWVRDEGLPAIESYSDPPRRLHDLQEAAALGSRPSYEIHHIVELNSATPEDANRINSSENLVSVPVFKHHLITGYYIKQNDAYQRKRLRDALKDRDWETRYRKGLEALVKYGVFEP